AFGCGYQSSAPLRRNLELPADGQRIGAVTDAVGDVDSQHAVCTGNLDSQTAAEIHLQRVGGSADSPIRTSEVREYGDTEPRKPRALEPPLRFDVRVDQR